MLCRRCGNKLQITNTYTSAKAKAQLGVCRNCNRKHTLLTTIVNDFDGRPARGEGPYATLKKLEKSEGIVESG